MQTALDLADKFNVAPTAEAVDRILGSLNQ